MERLGLNVLLHSLIEAKLQQKVDRISVIGCLHDIQRKRLLKRGQSTEALALKMIAAQVAPIERLGYAEDIIYNHGDPLELKQQVDQLDQFYRQLA